MLLGSDRVGNAIIDVIPSLPIHSSALIALISGLFLAALILRAQHLPRSTSAADHRESQTRRRRRARRRANMTVTPPGPAARRTGTPLRIHWGRAGLALLAVLSLLAGIVTGVLAPLTSAVSAVAPLVCVAVLLASLIGLRVSAVRRRSQSRRHRVERAFEEAMNPPIPNVPVAGGDRRAGAERTGGPQTAADETAAAETAVDEPVRVEPVAKPAGEPFNALSHDERGAGGPVSLQRVDVDGIPEGVGQTLPEGELPEPGYDVVTPGSGAAGEVWEPREVPKPRYLTAEKVERAAPVPVQPEVARPSSEVRLRQPAAPPVSPSAATPARAHEEPAEPARLDSSASALNLDEVLKRRRA